MNDLTINTQDSANLGAQSIVLRATAALKDVHGHALSELAKLEDKIVEAKHAIELQSNKAQMEITKYVELVNDALRVGKELEDMVSKITEATR